MDILREWLALLFCISCFSQRAYTQGFTSSPENVFICDPDSLAPSFSLTCGYEGLTVFPQWNVTGLSMHSDVLVTRGQPSVGFLTYTQATTTEATLDVSMNVAVTEGTCFQCTVDLLGGRVSSEKGCVTFVVPQCVSTVQVQTRTCSSITYTWTRPSPGLQYSTQVCPKDTPLCSNIINCTDCMSLTATGLSPNTNYTITIVSASSAGCVSQGCLDNVATASTQSITLPSPGATPDTVDVGIFAGTTSALALLLVLSIIAASVITFLCTRRCYSKKTTPPPPNEKSVYYGTVQSDSVQMQPSPAYLSVEHVK